jgi:nucleotide-binding universal stress UspA family protein
MTRSHTELAGRDRIVVGLDNSPAGAAALQWALREASQTDASVTVVSAFDPSTRVDLTASSDVEAEVSEHQRRVRDWVARSSPTLPADIAIRVTTPRSTVLSALADAAKGARCVVVGQPQDARHQELPTKLAGYCLCPIFVFEAGDPAHPVRV